MEENAQPIFIEYVFRIHSEALEDFIETVPELLDISGLDPMTEAELGDYALNLLLEEEFSTASWARLNSSTHGSIALPVRNIDAVTFHVLDGFEHLTLVAGFDDVPEW